MTRLPCVLRWAITMSLLSLLAAAAGPALAPAAIAVNADDLGGVPATDAAADADADAADLGGGGGSPDDSPSDGELVEDAILAGWHGAPRRRRRQSRSSKVMGGAESESSVYEVL